LTTRIHGLSLWQPWASLLATGLKQIETRDWPTKIRGQVAIHATKKPFRWADYEGRQWDQFNHHLDACYRREQIDPWSLPLHQILAIGELADCVPVESIRETLSPQELAFGDYSDGRYALIFKNVRQLASPIEIDGGQKLWFWDAPADLVFFGAKIEPKFQQLSFFDYRPVGRAGRITDWTKLTAEQLWAEWQQQFDSDDAAIATAVWMANRLVKDKARSTKQKLYSIKDEFIQLYGNVGKRARKEVQECWNCGGTGDDGDGWCDRCDGTGEYRSRWLYLHTFEVAGQRYSLHSYIAPKILSDDPPDASGEQQFGGHFTVAEQKALALPLSGLLKLLSYVAAARWDMKCYDGVYYPTGIRGGELEREIE